MGQLYEMTVQRFTDHLKFEKRYSPHTIDSYGNDLGQFYAYLKEQFGETEVEGISPAMIRSWLASLKENRIGSRSIVRKISSLKSFFKFAMALGFIPKNPATNITTPKINKRLPVYVEEAQLDTLFTHVDFPDDWKGKTERLALEMFYETGMRLSELVHCRESEIDFANRAVKVLGKGNKERIIPMGERLLGRIRVYREEKRKVFGQFDEKYLLVTEKGKKTYPKYIYRAVKKYLGMVTAINKKSPHVLRHSFATHLSNNGSPLNDIKALLGHSSLAATQVYTHNTIEKLKNAHKNAHPKG
ncbi:MAG TPA: tyrosine-type recombinase/integrase [Flavitalea sp.]|nr:tyrosine-type recombinase/integrase [Flavitalea sp.]